MVPDFKKRHETKCHVGRASRGRSVTTPFLVPILSISLSLCVIALPDRVVAAEEFKHELDANFSRFLLGLEFAVSTLAGACPRTWVSIESCRELVSGRLKPWIEKSYSAYAQIEGFDKFKHCTLSCVMALQCGEHNILPIGGAKELWDVVDGYIPEVVRGTSYDGRAEWADLEADYIGLVISWAPTVQARGEQECPRACQVYFPLSQKP